MIEAGIYVLYRVNDFEGIIWGIKNLKFITF